MRFLVDVNLPKYFSFFNNPDFLHVVDIERTMSDKDVWNHAMKHDLVILTKDTDYYLRSLVENFDKPKVVFFSIRKYDFKAIASVFC